MKRFVGAITFFAMAAMVLAGCSSDEPEEIITHVHDATIRVRVYQLVSGGGGSVNEVAVAGAQVELYKTESDRDQSINLVLEHATDGTGETSFVNLQEPKYFLRCTHPNHGELLDDVSTPDGTISFLDFIY